MDLLFYRTEAGITDISRHNDEGALFARPAPYYNPPASAARPSWRTSSDTDPVIRSS